MKIENVPALNGGENVTRNDSTMGRMLLDMGKITPADAGRVLALQAEKGLRFGEAAQQLGLVTEAEVQMVLASQFNYQYVQSEQSELDPGLVAAFDPFGAEAESLRALRSQLTGWLSGKTKSLAVVAVDDKASSHLVTANLAIVFAQQGQRTLLVDANLRTPRQHEVFGVQGKSGLSTALAGRTQSATLLGVKPFDKLSLLCAGAQPPNPQELLGMPSFAALSEGFSRDFDVVLYDAPSLTSAADAYAVAARAGGVLLVIRRSVARQADIREIRSQLLRRGVEIVGSVLVDF
ncbi:polysaccharide biosynthesis tyrosine autokinase [Pseudoduganella umbonata]|uniref:Chain length determinant protein tyrosine kinase EpsG n=1 Tax=Pseudoduganella umbonata TaxID=864828 RepID=A0A4P8HRS2_9BURK|nr:polysaccharide biosynthesis tyrosine autokinase [Pseudoduganella umbonata]MBB3222343.1 chain length determinant protein tyrosine kinase EpsG [Pseudoduganella umbonata]QCP12559.1 polysaccharide biosynthesis tyrosine autokinase [Pseudoduganella umbonata]